jgi:hypothetical protein
MVSCRPLVHMSGTHDTLSCPQRHLDSGVYWLRKRVADDLRQVVGKREETTQSRHARRAKRRHTVALSEIETDDQSFRKVLILGAL